MIGAEGVEAIRARVEAATPGPWHEDPDPEFRGEHWCCVTQGDFGWVAPGQGPVYDVDSEQGKADAEFVAHARTDIPLLLAALDRTREALRLSEGEREDLDTGAGMLLGENVELRAELDATNATIARAGRLVDEWLTNGVCENGVYPRSVTTAEDACARVLRAALASTDAGEVTP